MGKLFRLYIDESGDHHYHDYSTSQYNVPALRYLCLMGVIIESQTYKRTHDDLEALKQRHFVYDPDEPIIFHRTDIINKKGPFVVLKDKNKEEKFNHDLLQFLRNLDCVLITVVIDKRHHVEKYRTLAFHPYHYSLLALLERYCGYLTFYNCRGDVLAEHRGNKEDRNLASAFTSIYNTGTSYHPRSLFQRALTSKEIKIKTKSTNISGLQIADLLAHPCKQELLYEKGRLGPQVEIFGNNICEAIKDKYNVQIYSQKTKGYGKVFLG